MSAFDWKQDYTFIPYFQHLVKRICYPGWHMARTGCEYHNFTFVEKGHGVIEINGCTKPLVKGVFVYMTGDVQRSVTSSQEDPLEFSGVNFAYSVALFRDMAWQLCEPGLPFPIYQTIDHPFLYNRLVALFNELNTHWIGAWPDKYFRCQRVFMEIFKLMIEWQENRSSLPYPQTKKIQQVIDYMADNLQDQISLEDLSEQFGISTSHLDYLFRKITGKSPMQYLALIRINKAKQLLIENYSVTQTAQATGFNDKYYFSRYFKKMTGYTPSSFSEQR